MRSRFSGLASSSAAQRLDRAQVGVEAEALAQAEQPLLGPRRVGVGRVPLRAADRAEQDRVGGAALLQHLVGERGAVRVDRGAADQVLVDLDAAELRRAASSPPRRSRGRCRRRRAGRRGCITSASAASRLDVEPHVVERRTGRPVSATHRVDELRRAAPSGRRARCGPRPTRAHELARLRRGERLVLQPSSVRCPRTRPPRSRSSVSSGLGEVPQRRHALEVLGERRRRVATATIACAWSATLPAPPHCATQPAAGPQHAVDAPEEVVVVGDPVEGGGGEDDVDRLGAAPARRGP